MKPGKVESKMNKKTQESLATITLYPLHKHKCEIFLSREKTLGLTIDGVLHKYTIKHWVDVMANLDNQISRSMKDIKALKLAIKVLEMIMGRVLLYNRAERELFFNAIDACKEAINSPEQEPNLADMLLDQQLAIVADGLQIPVEKLKKSVEQIKHPQDNNFNAMVDRFLSWKLPASVKADGCASDPTYPYRLGTHLLNADEARQMIEHVIGSQEREPVAWVYPEFWDHLKGAGCGTAYASNGVSGGNYPDEVIRQALYIHPPVKDSLTAKKPLAWQSLNDADHQKLRDDFSNRYIGFEEVVINVEKILKEKNVHPVQPQYHPRDDIARNIEK